MILSAESGRAQVKASRRYAGRSVGEEAGGARWAQLQRQKAGGGATTITPNRCSAQRSIDLMSHSVRSAAKAKRARDTVMVD